MTDPAFAPEDAWILANPTSTYDAFCAAGFDASRNAFLQRRSKFIKQGKLARQPGSPFSRTPNPDALVPKDGAPDVRHNKPDVSCGDDLTAIARERQAQHQAMSGATDFPEFFIESDRPVPVLFIADWHVGSWGTDYDAIDAATEEIERLGLKVAVLGDMLQMSINMRSVLEVMDNLLTPREQMRWMQQWLERMAPHILWVTWDNHTIMREEKVTGYSWYAEMVKDKVVYSSGINHVDIMVGGADFETYKIASSHRFRGRSMYNALHGQQQYMRLEGVDRELCVAGDSHRPAVSTYYDGPVKRAALNVGTAQTNSGYARRFFSLYTHDDMPLIEFWPDVHAFQVYDNLAAYKRQLALRQAA